MESGSVPAIDDVKVSLLHQRQHAINVFESLGVDSAILQFGFARLTDLATVYALPEIRTVFAFVKKTVLNVQVV